MAKGKLNYSSKTMGSFGTDAFFQTRFRILSENLSPSNRKAFSEMSLEKKKRIIAGMIERGRMI